MGKGQLKEISRTFKLWLLPTPQLQLFSRPLCALASSPTELSSIPKHFYTCSCFQVSIHAVPSASNLASLLFISLTHTHPSSFPLPVPADEKPSLSLKARLSVPSVCVCGTWLVIDYNVHNGLYVWRRQSPCVLCSLVCHQCLTRSLT